MIKKKKESGRGRRAGNEVLPIRPSSKRKESLSRDSFGLAVAPWMVTHWESHDYGIDAMVEITRPALGDDDEIVTGKRFGVQIKATSSRKKVKGMETLRVPVRRISYWLHSTEPIMLVRYGLSRDTFHFLWIDDALVGKLTKSRPRWIMQKTVTLHFSEEDEIRADAFKGIEEYVIRWKRSSRALILPGEYFKLKDQAIQLVEDANVIIDEFGFKSVTQGLDSISEDIRAALYVVAITGPSRAGKSTLLNAMVGHDVSPIDILPTTGLPLAVVPGKEDLVEVTLEDGSVVNGPVTSEFLLPYVSQDENPDNRRGVKYIEVHLVNPELERGISFLDMPGLDDPSPDVRQVTRAALEMAHAVIYVVNAAPMRNGGFAITNQIIQDLKSIGHRVDRLFLVLNKVDVLEPAHQRQMGDYVEKALAKYGVKDLIPVSPLLVSAKDSWETREQHGEPSEDTVSQLESSLWDFLLNQSKTGLFRLGDAAKRLKTAIGDFDTLMRTRLMEAAQSALLEEHLRKGRGQLPDIRNRIQDQKSLLLAKLSDSVATRQRDILTLMRHELSNMPSDKPLPSRKRIRTFLETQAHRATSDVHEELVAETRNLKIALDEWIERMLGQIRIAIRELTDEPQIEIPVIPETSIPVSEDFSGAVAGALGLGMVGLIFGPVGGLFGALFGWLAGLVLSAEHRRARRIDMIVKRSKELYQRIFCEIENQMCLHVENICAQMEQFAMDRVSMFLHDIEEQRRLLGTPLTQDEMSRYKNAITDLSALAPRIDALQMSLLDYSY